MTKTKKAKTYWEGNGRYESVYQNLMANLVPEEGRAPTPHGALLSAISRVYYDWYNNGGCNLDTGRFQLALYTIRDWYEEIDAKATRGFEGTRDIIDRPIRWSKCAPRSPRRSYGMDDAWEV